MEEEGAEGAGRAGVVTQVGAGAGMVDRIPLLGHRSEEEAVGAEGGTTAVVVNR